LGAWAPHMKKKEKRTSRMGDCTNRKNRVGCVPQIPSILRLGEEKRRDNGKMTKKEQRQKKQKKRFTDDSTILLLLKKMGEKAASRGFREGREKTTERNCLHKETGRFKRGGSAGLGV